MAEPVEIVVVGMIDAAGSRGKVQVERGNAEVLKEWSVVGTRAQGGEAELMGRVILKRVQERLAGFRMIHVARNFLDESFERMGTLGVEPALAGGIRVDVSNQLPIELVRVFLHPLGGPDEPELFAVPEREQDGALRFPAVSSHLSERARGLH